jgi:hypothetical protein
MGDTAPQPGIPAHFEKEWAEARQIIDKQDDRVQQTREKVFGLFSSLLTASSVFGGNLSASGAKLLWVGAHLSLLGLLLAGRFIEQQAVLLQSAAASRAFALELLTPVELTDTLSARYRTGWGQRTTYVYLALGGVSTVVFLILSGLDVGRAATIIGLTLLYSAYVVRIGRLDLTFARGGQDWSFSATTCRQDEVISILLVNLGDEPVLPVDPPAALYRIARGDGTPVDERGETLRLDAGLLDVGKSLPPRRALRWLWEARKPGLWTLELFGPGGGFARRCIQVLPSRCAAPNGTRVTDDEGVSAAFGD